MAPKFVVSVISCMLFAAFGTTDGDADAGVDTSGEAVLYRSVVVDCFERAHTAPIMITARSTRPSRMLLNTSMVNRYVFVLNRDAMYAFASDMRSEVVPLPVLIKNSSCS